MIADDFSYHFQRSEEISFLSTLERKVENRYKPIWKLLHKSLFPLEFLDKPRKRLKFNLVQRKKKSQYQEQRERNHYAMKTLQKPVSFAHWALKAI